MKLMIAGFSAVALAILSLSIPAPVFTTQASASRMDGKGNCSGGTCTEGGSTWNPSGGRQKSIKTKNIKNIKAPRPRSL
jgi:hypothetical protein